MNNFDFFKNLKYFVLNNITVFIHPFFVLESLNYEKPTTQGFNFLFAENTKVKVELSK